MENYRKLIAAIVGLLLLLANRIWGADLLGTDTIWTETIISVGTAASVWFFPNQKAAG